MKYAVLLYRSIFVAVLAGCRGNVLITAGQGRLKGSYMTSSSGRKFAAFRGIPYAEPPIGQLRFRDPVPAAAWHGVLDATREGPSCISRNPFNLAISGTEDCLNLNVYTHHVTNQSINQPILTPPSGSFGDLYRRCHHCWI